jgi:hypothetical protein
MSHGVSPEDQLAGFIARYSPEMQEQAHDALARMRALLPNSVEMVYDNYNALVCGFSPTERPSEAVFSVVLNPRHVSICFIQGASLPDPHSIFLGNGNQVRHIKLKSPADLELPEIRETMRIAMDLADPPFDASRPYCLVIKSISAKQRPRIPSGK